VKKFIQTLKNIWSIEELRSKILVTITLIAVYRLGTHIVLPGIDPDKITVSSAGGILGLIDAFAGGAFHQASILALGIMPYISASIFIQLMTILYPPFQKLQKEGDSGRKKINQYTRYLTVLVTILQASAYVAFLRSTNGQAITYNLFGVLNRHFTNTLDQDDKAHNDSNQDGNFNYKDQ
jgi:preprotein translocase subunit SecY